VKAFPSSEPIYGNDIVGVKQSTGMDLRDYFAAKSLPLSFKIWENFHSSDENDATYKTSNFQADGQYMDLIAMTAYQIANAMMKAREND
jgi:basic membrane lipoprotein Med (substrate-binding protein (PBP1-ABC) superfamily)